TFLGSFSLSSSAIQRIKMSGEIFCDSKLRKVRCKLSNLALYEVKDTIKCPGKAWFGVIGLRDVPSSELISSSISEKRRHWLGFSMSPAAIRWLSASSSSMDERIW